LEVAFYPARQAIDGQIAGRAKTLSAFHRKENRLILVLGAFRQPTFRFESNLAYTLRSTAQ
jgi:hypothetical protein